MTMMMTTAAQIRAARALLGITVDELSARSGVSSFLILQCEAPTGSALDGATLHHLRETLEGLGVSFLSDGDCVIGGEGVRLTKRDETGEGIRPENLNATNDG